jgi:hypothetical protein
MSGLHVERRACDRRACDRYHPRCCLVLPCKSSVESPICLGMQISDLKYSPRCKAGPYVVVLCGTGCLPLNANRSNGILLQLLATINQERLFYAAPGTGDCTKEEYMIPFVVQCIRSRTGRQGVSVGFEYSKKILWSRLLVCTAFDQATHFIQNTIFGSLQYSEQLMQEATGRGMLHISQ